MWTATDLSSTEYRRVNHLEAQGQIDTHMIETKKDADQEADVFLFRFLSFHIGFHGIVDATNSRAHFDLSKDGRAATTEVFSSYRSPRAAAIFHAAVLAITVP
jgi:hypothetical protein